MATNRPNILWICTDQQRFDTISGLGNEAIRTPHIDALMKTGVTFTRTYCQSPVCTPSRASFLTGRYPRTTRCRQNGQQLPADERLVTRYLADAGYTCGLAGKLHLASCADGRVEVRGDDGYQEFHWSHHPSPDWEENAYTQWLASKGQSWEKLYAGESSGFVKMGVPAEFHQTTWCTEMTMEMMHRFKNDASPWLISFNCFDPHHPFDPPADYLARVDPAKVRLPKFRPDALANKTKYQQLDHRGAADGLFNYDFTKMTEDQKRLVVAAYYAMVELIDDNVGHMIQTLKNTGQYENTLVIFMSDHGELLGDHGLFLKGPHFYEESIRVPLVISWPGQFAADTKCDDFVELTDLAPTLMAAAGEDVPFRMQGKSLLPILEGKTDGEQHRDRVYCEYYNAWQHPHSYGTMLRTDRWKIVVYHGTEEGELYDLENDPDEFDNLWNNPAHASDKLAMMKQAFDASVFTLDPEPPRLGAF